MENKYQKGSPAQGATVRSPASPSIGVVHAPPPDGLAGVALDGSQTSMAFVSKKQSGKQASLFSRLTRRLDIILVFLFVVGAVIFFLNATRDRDGQSGSLTTGGRYGTVALPLDELISGKDLTIDGSSNVTINGSLQLNNDLALSPSVQPTGAKAGQIYYDSGVNQLAYFNGEQFVFLTAGQQGLQSLGGVSGQLTLGAGLAMAGNQLSNSGVLSVQGQNGSIVFTAGPGIVINGTNFSNSGILSIAAGSPNVTVSNNNGSVTIDVVGGTGTVTSGTGGTVGRIPLFTASQNIEDSIVTQSGLAVTVGGDLQVTGNATLSNALTVGNGGTGANSLTNNGVLVGQGTGAITSVAAVGTGLCLLSTAGVPAWGACPGGSSVTSLNGLTGGLTIANANGVGSTITIDNASTSGKGIASFDGTNFTVTGGAVNTIQNINSGATPTFAGVNTNAITPSSTLTVGSTGQTLILQGGAATTLSATSGANSTTISFQAPTAVVTYRFATASAGSYDICTTAGNCVGTGGGVSTAGGTTNRLAKFSGSQTIDNSTITDDGTTVSTTVDLVVQGGAVTIGVPSSQSGVLNLAHSGSVFTGSIVQGGLTNDRTYLLPDADGTFCLTSGNCAGVGGTGDILQGGNSFSADMTIGTNDAFALNLETSGVTRLTVAADGSNVSLATNTDFILQGATAYISNTQGQTSSEAFGQGATVSGTQAVAAGNGATTCTNGVAIGYNATIINCGTGGVAIGHSVSTNPGSVAIGNGAGTGNNGIAIGNGTTGSGTSVGIGFSVDAGTRSIAIGDDVTTGSDSVAIGHNALASTSRSIALGRGATTTATNQLVVGGSTASTGYITQAYLGSGVTDTTPQSIVLNATGGSGTDIAGANFTIAGGRGTGTGNGGTINFQIADPAASTGSSLNALSTVFSLSGTNGAATLQNSTDSAAALLVRNAAGTASVLSVNTASPGVIIQGTGTNGAGGRLLLGSDSEISISEYNGTDSDILGYDARVGHVFSLDGTVAAEITQNGLATFISRNDAFGGLLVTQANGNRVLGVSAAGGEGSINVGYASDLQGTIFYLDADATSEPAGAEGGMYYNNSTNTFRCYQNTGWTNCIAADTLQTAYDSGNLITTTNGRNIEFDLTEQTNDPNFLVDLQCDVGCGGNGRFAIQDSGADVFTISPAGGFATFRPSSLSTTAFNIQLPGGENLFTVDTQNSRVGINLGLGATPTLDGSGLEIQGGLRMSGGSTFADEYTTPLGVGLQAKINIPNYDPGAGNAVIALGLDTPGVGTANDTATGISVFDTRTNANHWPTIAVWSPDENNIMGLTWAGSSLEARVTTHNSAVSSASIALQSGDTADDQASTSGNVAIRTGNGVGTDSSSGSINIDTGTATGNGTIGTITIGGTNTNSITIGKLTGSASTTIQGGTGDINLTTNAATASIIAKSATNNNEAFKVVNSGDVSLLSVKTNGTLGTDMGTYVTGTGTNGAGGRLFFGTSNLYIGESSTTDTDFLEYKAEDHIFRSIGGTEIMRLDGDNGKLTLNVQNDDFGGLNIFDSNDEQVFFVDPDATDPAVFIGNDNLDSLSTVLVLDTTGFTMTEQAPSDGRTLDGAMYYSASRGTFRCFDGGNVDGSEANDDFGGQWKECLGVPKPNTRRWTYITHPGSGTTFDTQGDAVSATADATTNQAATTSEPSAVRYATNTSSGNIASMEGNANYNSSNNPTYQAYVAAQSTSDIRIWAGLSSQTGANMGASATPGSAEYAAFRYDSAVDGGGDYQCVLGSAGGGGTPFVQGSGIAVGTGGHKLEVTVFSGKRVMFKIDGEIVCSISAVTAGADFPAASTMLRYVNTVTTLTTAAKSIQVAWVYVETDK